MQTLASQWPRLSAKKREGIFHLAVMSEALQPRRTWRTLDSLPPLIIGGAGYLLIGE